MQSIQIKHFLSFLLDLQADSWLRTASFFLRIMLIIALQALFIIHFISASLITIACIIVWSLIDHEFKMKVMSMQACSVSQDDLLYIWFDLYAHIQYIPSSCIALQTLKAVDLRVINKCLWIHLNLLMYNRVIYHQAAKISLILPCFWGSLLIQYKSWIRRLHKPSHLEWAEGYILVLPVFP